MAMKKTKESYFVGVRFIQHPKQIFTYKVNKKVLLGDELVVDNEYGTSVVVVVRHGKNSDYNGPYKTITRKVAKL